MKAKQELNEVIGVGITWLDSGSGGELILENNELLILNITNNRIVTDSSITDFDWYLKKIINIFNINGVVIKDISCFEYK